MSSCQILSFSVDLFLVTDGVVTVESFRVEQHLAFLRAGNEHVMTPYHPNVVPSVEPPPHCSVDGGAAGGALYNERVNI